MSDMPNTKPNAKPYEITLEAPTTVIISCHGVLKKPDFPKMEKEVGALLGTVNQVMNFILDWPDAQNSEVSMEAITNSLTNFTAPYFGWLVLLMGEDAINIRYWALILNHIGGDKRKIVTHLKSRDEARAFFEEFPTLDAWVAKVAATSKPTAVPIPPAHPKPKFS
jgi:hypothetical protein